MGHLFFYGTLMYNQGNTLARALAPKLGPGRRAFVRGRLLGIATYEGWYPGLVPGKGRVEGWLYRCGAGFDRRTLAILDEYEGFNPRRRARSEYLRRTVPVFLAGGGTLLAQVYVWNAPLPLADVEIRSGSFARFVAETGLPVFG